MRKNQRPPGIILRNKQRPCKTHAIRKGDHTRRRQKKSLACRADSQQDAERGKVGFLSIDKTLNADVNQGILCWGKVF